jgi:hypothetical protein
MPTGNQPKLLQFAGHFPTRQMGFKLLFGLARLRTAGAVGQFRCMSQLLVYKPNFCSQCGNRLLRLRWHFWTSRRFCDDCARRLRKERLLPGLVAALTLVSAGYCVGRARRSPPPPLTIVRRADSPLSAPEDPGRASATTTTSEFGMGPKGTSTSATETVEEEVYICGARTKKGTPCSRRVHGPVRCWQHKGMPAMLPPEKLLVKE